jgi:hypothetical protein
MTAPTERTIPGRAHTPEQKRELLDRLYVAWLKKPQLRLGRLVFNATARFDAKKIHHDDRFKVGGWEQDTFNLEDASLIEEIEREAGR